MQSKGEIGDRQAGGSPFRIELGHALLQNSHSGQRGAGVLVDLAHVEHGHQAVAHEFQDIAATTLNDLDRHGQIVVQHAMMSDPGSRSARPVKPSRSKFQITASICCNDPRRISPDSTRWPASPPR